MAAIKTIPRLSTAAFSPAENFIAVGTITSSLDASFSASTSVQIHKLDLASDGPELPIVRSYATPEALCRLAWSPVAEKLPSGLLAGSLADGSIHCWDPSSKESENNEPLHILNIHRQKCLGLDFCPEVSNIMSSGSTDGIIYIWDLNANLENPARYPALQYREGEGNISNLSWNGLAKNIFATSTYDVGCLFWDIRKQKSILNFADPNGSRCYSAVQWSGVIPTVAIVAVEDDNNPVLQAWDLRSASRPFQVFTGHTKGVVSLASCPSDSSILMSSAKDNRTLFWDTTNGQIIGELPTNTWNFDLHWSNQIPGVFSASSHDGQVGIYSFESCHTNYNHGAAVQKAPKWLKRPVSASFAFGGKLVTLSTSTVPGTEGPLKSEVKVHTSTIEEDMGKCSAEFEAAVSAGDRKAHMKSFCDRKLSDIELEQERDLWSFLKIMLEEDGGRKSLLKQLGFKYPEVEAAADEVGEDTLTELSTSHTDETSFQVIDNAEDFFDNLEEAKEPEVAPVENGKREEDHGKAEEDHVIEEGAVEADRETDEKIELALVLGNFKEAVDHCLSVNRMADALVIAYAGGQTLWEKTRAEHLKKSRRSYLQVVSAIASHDLKGLAESRALSTWKETLALLGTYCRGDEWAAMTNTLASRLDSAGDVQAATICYICAGNVEKTVEVLSRQLKGTGPGKHAVGNLQDLVEKSIVLTLATDQKRTAPALAAFVERYAELLANQGLLESAMVYISLLPGQLPQSLVILQDRIHRNSQVSTSAPEPAPKPQQVYSKREYMPSQTYSGPSPQVPIYSAPRTQAVKSFVPEAQPPVRAMHPMTPPMRTPSAAPPMVPSMSAPPLPTPMMPPPNTGAFAPSMAPRPGNMNPAPFNPMTPGPQVNPPLQTSHVPRPSYSTPSSSHMFTTPPPPPTNAYNAPPSFTVPPQASAYNAPPPFTVPPQTNAFTAPPPVSVPPQTNAFTAPPPFAAPPQQINRFTAPPPQTNTYSAPPPQTNTFSAPPPQMNTFSAPPPQTNTFTPPPPQMNTFTAPPPPQMNMFPPAQTNMFAGRPSSPAPQPLSSHLTESPTPPTPPPTVETVDTSSVRDGLKPVVDALTRLYFELLEAKKFKDRREADDTSRRLGNLFAKLNAGGVSPTVDGKLIQLGEALNARNISAALAVQAELTANSWEDCSHWVTVLRRMLKLLQ